MKKVFSLLLAIMALFLCENVYAMDEYGIYCQYNDLYFKYYSNNVNSVFQIDTNFDEMLNINVEEGRPKKFISNSEEITWLESKGFITDFRGKKRFACPNNPFGTTNLNISLKTYGKASGIIDDFPIVTPVYAKYNSTLPSNGVYCTYGVDRMDGTGQFITDENGNKRVFYSFSYYGNNLDSTYRFGNGYDRLQQIQISINDGRPGNPLNNQQEINWLIEKGIIISTGVEEYKKNWSCPTLLDDINDLDGDGHTRYTLIDASCKTTTGTDGSICFIANIRGSESSGSATDLENGSCPNELRPIFKFIKKAVINTLQIFVPILLIVMGSIDLVKAVMAMDDKALKESTGKLIKRAIAAVLLFFVTTIVVIIMDMFARTDIGSQNDWKACWIDLD